MIDDGDESSAVADLVARIFEWPDDDAPRVLLQDYLVDRGDPRGEFIRLQLARERGELDLEGRRAEARLLRRHQDAWLAGAAEIVEERTKVSFGPTRRWGRLPGVRWRRGFLAGARIAPTARRLSRASGSLVWATVEALSIRPGLPRASWKALEAFLSSLGGLRRIDELDLGLFQRLTESGAGARLEHVEVNAAARPLRTGELLDFIHRGAPSLVRLGVKSERATSELSPTIAALSTSSRAARVRKFCFDGPDATVFLRRDGDGTFGAFMQLTSNANIEPLLAGLDPAALRSLLVVARRRARLHEELAERVLRAADRFTNLESLEVSREPPLAMPHAFEAV